MMAAARRSASIFPRFSRRLIAIPGIQQKRFFRERILLIFGGAVIFGVAEASSPGIRSLTRHCRVRMTADKKSSPTRGERPRTACALPFPSSCADPRATGFHLILAGRGHCPQSSTYSRT
ncbi:hypothetical protein MRX96_031472 [Rhipicephalus microplus]